MDLRLNFDIYPVTCEQLSGGRSDEEVLDGVIAGGAKIIQLRDKVSPRDVFLEKAKRFRDKTANAGVVLIINDYFDIAVEIGADGVHLGQDDLSVLEARAAAPEMIIGASSHNLEEALAAQEAGASYVNIGPIFSTATKRVPMKPLGPQAVTEIAPHLHIPFTVMGGINLDNIDSVLKAGARRIAVVTAITQASDIKERVQAFRRRILNHNH